MYLAEKIETNMRTKKIKKSIEIWFKDGRVRKGKVKYQVYGRFCVFLLLRATQILSESLRTSDPGSFYKMENQGLDRPVNTPDKIKESQKNSFLMGSLTINNQRHQKRSSSSRTSHDPFSSYSNSNFEFFSTWNLTELEDISTATEMSDDQMRSLGFPVPSTERPSLERETHRHPVLDNPFIHFLSRK